MSPAQLENCKASLQNCSVRKLLLAEETGIVMRLWNVVKSNFEYSTWPFAVPTRKIWPFFIDRSAWIKRPTNGTTTGCFSVIVFVFLFISLFFLWFLCINEATRKMGAMCCLKLCTREPSQSIKGILRLTLLIIGRRNLIRINE